MLFDAKWLQNWAKTHPKTNEKTMHISMPKTRRPKRKHIKNKVPEPRKIMFFPLAKTTYLQNRPNRNVMIKKTTWNDVHNTEEGLSTGYKDRGAEEGVNTGQYIDFKTEDLSTGYEDRGAGEGVNTGQYRGQRM